MMKRETVEADAKLLWKSSSAARAIYRKRATAGLAAGGFMPRPNALGGAGAAAGDKNHLANV